MENSNRLIEEEVKKLDDPKIKDIEYGCDGMNENCCGGCSYREYNEEKLKTLFRSSLEKVRQETLKEVEEMKKKLNTLRCDYPCDYDCVTCKTILRAIEIINSPTEWGE